MNDKIKILICDDNEAVHESLSAYLKLENMEATSVYDGEEALKEFKINKYDLIILDIMLPKIFGTEVCKEIRKKYNVPIIMLSAKAEESDRILGLELGADDYITKPFSPREVVVRIKTILKRMAPINNRKIRVAELSIDKEAYEVYVENTKIELTPKEIETLFCLAENLGKVMSREQILNKVWGYDFYGDTRAVDTQIKRLRQKLPTERVHFSIKAIYGVGYKLEVLK